MTSRPARDLSSAGVPSAMTRPWSMITMRSARWSASSRYWVVSSDFGAVGDELAYGFPQRDAARRVEPGGRLVEQQDAGPADEARAEVEAAAHPARPAAHETVGGIGEVEPVEYFRRVAAGVGGGLAEQAGHHLEVLPPGHRLLDRGRLAGEPDQGPHAVRLAQGVDAGHAQRAGVGPGQRRHRAHERRLAGAVRSEHGEHAAGRGRHRQPVQGGDLAVVLVEAFGLDHRFHLEPPGV